MKPNAYRCAALIVVLAVGAIIQVSEAMAGAGTPAAASNASAPVATRAQNRALRRSVYAAFAKDKAIDAGDIGVRANDGVITLTGTVGDAAHIGKAAELARDVPGVRSVTNKLTVKRPFGQ
ncbi:MULTISPECIES: BON domain-containing protein [unclassified Caballeronia]|uniref:BON domain-containing protein n=1 Tax=unclassified Caballeronia TaxID=2646786 RepID=UPI00285B82B5|nr:MULTISPECIES: BON domain-containing protein [unclassified Caballeronia]MDR5741018.1 BON domain-containing protein [Caballeronia sp. LZ016]MDR5806917.1 BON domain-containing protein [Caballeronia sp. LZ019]